MSQSRDDHAAGPRPLSAREGGFLALLRWLPSSLLSAWAGKLASFEWPAALRKPVCVLFGRAVGVDFDEVRDPLTDFPSLQAFFTRALRPGVRPVDADPLSFVSPCDGAWGASGRVEHGTLLQAKGRTYRLAEMIADPALAQHFEGGEYSTLYLSPRDYHRFHAPCDMWIRRAVYVPGSLWPVNRLGIEGVEGLFARNERLVAQIALSGPDAEDAPVDLCIVAVGAMMVGKVKLSFDDLTTRTDGGGAPVRDYPAPGIPLEKAQEWGHFEFGSTLVVVAAPGRVRLDLRPPGTPIRLGEAMGRLEAVSSAAR